MGVWCGAFYGHLRTETDFYGLQLVRRPGKKALATHKPPYYRQQRTI